MEPYTIPEERNLSEILLSVMDNYQKYIESENLGNKFNYFIEIGNMKSRLLKNGVCSSKQGSLIAVILDMISDETREKMEDKRKYWMTLETLAECFDKGRVTTENVQDVKRFYPELAASLKDCI